MALDPTSLAKTMLAAVQESLGSGWKKVSAYADGEIRRLAQSMADTAQLVADGKITAREAESLLRIHQNTGRTVMLAAEGMGIIAVENAINAALGVVRDTVNKAAGAAIL